MFTDEMPPTPAIQKVRPYSRSSDPHCISRTPVKHTDGSSSILRQVFYVASGMKPRKALAFFLRTLLAPRSTLQWLRFLNDFAAQHTLASPHDDLVQKNLFFFLVYRMPRRSRLNILTEHFDLARQLLDPHMLRTLWIGGSIGLGTVCGRDHQYCLQLLLSDHCGTQHEGVFTVRLVRAVDQALLCKASFVFVRRPCDSYSLIVGGLQGAAHETAKRTVISATRDLGGLRPKDAIMLFLRGVLAHTHSTTTHLIAVSNSSHVINYRVSRDRRKKLPDMDAYWRERGGLAFPPFGFQIPLDPMINDGSGSRRSNAKIAFWNIGSNLIVRRGHDHRISSAFGAA